MSTQLPRYQAGYASAICTINRSQINAQKQSIDGLAASRFVNSKTNGASYDMLKGDIVWKHMPAIGNRYNAQGEMNHYNSIISVLTGLQCTPQDEFEEGIEEIVKNKRLSEDTLRMSLMAGMQVIGFSVDDFRTEAKCTKTSVTIGVQIAGVHTLRAYEPMITGRLVRAVVPKQALYQSQRWFKNAAHGDQGRITLIPAMVSENDVVTYARVIMSEYMHRNGTDSLELMRTRRSYNMFSNFAQSANELFLTAGILAVVALMEQGLVAIPQRPAGVAVNRDGSNLGVVDEIDALRVFGGQGLPGNHGKIYYGRNRDGDVTDEIKFTTPSELGVFLACVTGLIADPDQGNDPGATPGNTDRAVYHARKVATDPMYSADRKAVQDFTYRFLAMMTAKNDGTAGAIQEEFGNGQHGATTHVARELKPGMTASPIRRDMAGKMLRQQYHAWPNLVQQFNNLVTYNNANILGKIISGSDADKNFSLYMY